MMHRRVSTMVAALALAVLVATAAVQAQQLPNPGPVDTGYVVNAVTADLDDASTSAPVQMSLTFFAPGSHQMFWALESGLTDHQRGQTDFYFFDDAYSPFANNLPHLSLRIGKSQNSAHDWIWDVIFVQRFENGQLITSKSWYWERKGTEIEPGRPWAHFGPGTPLYPR